MVFNVYRCIYTFLIRFAPNIYNVKTRLLAVKHIGKAAVYGSSERYGEQNNVIGIHG